MIQWQDLRPGWVARMLVEASRVRSKCMRAKRRVEVGQLSLRYELRGDLVDGRPLAGLLARPLTGVASCSMAGKEHGRILQRRQHWLSRRKLNRAWLRHSSLEVRSCWTPMPPVSRRVCPRRPRKWWLLWWLSSSIDA